MSNVIEISANRKKVILITLACLLMAILCILSAYLAAHDNGDFYSHLHPAMIKAIYSISTIGAVFFSIGLIAILCIGIRNKGVLSITEDGFYDNSTLWSHGFVEWKNVKDISLYNSLSGLKDATNPFITVTVIDPSLVKQKPLNRFSGKKPSDKIYINLSYSTYKREDVLKLMSDAFNRWSARQ